jgi:regulator of cell morphogenesis and NO signaling
MGKSDAMAIVEEQSIVSEIALAHPETLPVFEAHGIDYCCGGAQSIAAACARRPGLEPKAVIEDLERAIAAGRPADEGDPRQLSTLALVSRIVDRHHGYLRAALPELGRLAGKVSAVHGARDPRLFAIERRLGWLCDTILRHLAFEEERLFPALLDVAGGKAAEGAIARDLASMFAEHEEVGSALAEIRALSGDFSVPAEACPTYHAYFQKLRELESDVHRHVHLENNVLLPRFAPRPDRPALPREPPGDRVES